MVAARKAVKEHGRIPGCCTYPPRILFLIALPSNTAIMPEAITHIDKQFSAVDYSERQLRNREFIRCEFIKCDFGKSDLKGNDFEDCIFTDCNFSLADLQGTGFRNAVFVGCKMLGVAFAQCNPFAFSVSFDQCHLDYSNFYGAKLRKTTFKNSSLKEAEFAEADLTASEFLDCDLSAANFSNTILDRVDFRTAMNYSIDPERNKLKKARFSALNLGGLLDQYDLVID